MVDVEVYRQTVGLTTISPSSSQEPLNSEDDVSDEEDLELFDTENVVVCQYDKVRATPRQLHQSLATYRPGLFQSRAFFFATTPLL